VNRDLQRPYAPQSDLPGVSFYENAVPSFAADALERRYQNTFSSSIAEHADEAETSTYVVRTIMGIRTVFLFQVRGRHVIVLNSAIPIEADDIEAFVESVFARYPDVQTIRFASVETHIAHSRFPYQQFRMSEDYVLDLPSTVEAYHQRLGKSAATTLRRKQNKLDRAFPDARCDIHEGGETGLDAAADIVRLKTSGSGPAARLDDGQQAWLRKVVHTHGFVSAIVIGGRVCAGTICTRVGRNYFLHVVAHDPAFDAYSPGVLCAYHTICAAIVRGGSEFHFLWGQAAWKARLRAVQHELNDVVIYRSRLDAVRCATTVARNWHAEYWRRLRLGLVGAASAEHPGARIARPLLEQWHRLKRSGRR
jgi:hypothetical protein